MRPTPGIITLKTMCPPTQYSEKFLQGMINRCSTGFLKYGHIADHAVKTDWLGSAELREREYMRTGNTEMLIDLANFVMFEFVHPQHPGAFFKGTDSHESPGLIALDGTLIDRREQS